MIKIINLYINGHDYEHDLFELTRAFFTQSEITVLKNEDLDKEYKYLILNEFSSGTSITKIFINDNLVGKEVVYSEAIEIPSYDKVRIEKMAIKNSLYICLSKYLGRQLPWGILTGIRPVKIIHELLDKKIYNDDIINILKDYYKFDYSKAEMILDIALSQRTHIYPKDNRKFSLYINIPFCPSKCSYCSFPSYPIGKVEDQVPEYINTLIYELKASKEIFKNKKINTVYIGGGTPTSLKVVQLEKLLKEIRNIFPERIKEFTVEAGRPDTIDEVKLELLKKYGVNRISINPQTFNKKTLVAIKRNHSLKEIKHAYNLAKSIGFDIINMDIILGLPGEGLQELENTLSKIKKLNPENLTVHILALKRGSKLYNNVEDYNFTSNIEKMLSRSHDFALEEGYLPYYMYRQKQILGNLENIGYSKKSMECIYNISMMEEKETIFGFGLGAVSKIYSIEKDKVKRIPNFKSLNDYMSRIDELIERKLLDIDRSI